MAVLYIASNQEEAGKTAMCVTLAHMLQEQGKTVALLKPVARAGSTVDADLDTSIYAKLLDQDSNGNSLRRPDEGMDAEAIEAARVDVSRLSDGADVVLVEGSCGLSLAESRRLVDALGAKTLSVIGFAGHLSTSQMLPWRETFADALLGFVTNGLTRYQGTDTRSNLLPAMASEGLVNLGVIPEDRRMLGVSVGQIAEHLEARFIACQERADALVEHLMVGGLGLDPGDLYFGLRQNKAVVVRGDRPDLHMACLATPTACMVLTEGIEPIEYVKYEAELKGVPVMVVETDTLATMEALDTLMERARFDHPLKLRRFAELVTENVDLPALFGGLGVKV